MKKILLALALAAAPLRAETPLPSWLAGIWMMEDGASWTDALWTDAKGGIMLGLSRTGFGNELQSWDSQQIQRKADGTVVLVYQRQGRGAMDYPMVLSSDDAIEFANPAHDDPQRIRYWRQGQLLMAEMSKLDGSDVVRLNYRPVMAPRDIGE